MSSQKSFRSAEEPETAALSTRQLALVLARLHEGVIVQALDGRPIYANDRAARIAGFESGEALVNAGPADVFARFEILDEFGNPLQLDDLPARRVLRGEAGAETIVRYRDRETSHDVWAVVSAAMVHDDAGTPLFVVNAVHDITAHMEQEAALEASAQQLEELTIELEQTNEELRARTEEAVWAATRARFLAEAGQVLASSLDYEETLKAVARLAVPRIADWCTINVVDDGGTTRRLEVAHADPTRLAAALEYEKLYPQRNDDSSVVYRVMQSRRPELIPEVTESVLKAVARSEDQLQRLRELGFRSAMVVPLTAHDRALGALTLIAAESGRVYTEQDMESALELARRAALAIDTARLYREAQEASQAKSQFIAVMSHELRTPLNAVIGYTELLEGGIPGPLNEKQMAHIGRIRTGAWILTQTIDEILTFSRVEAGREVANPHTVSLGQVLNEATLLVEPSAASKGLSFEVVAPQESVTLVIDSHKLRQILLNLLSNAIKFTDKGAVTLSASLEEHRVAFRVTDTGPGIPATAYERIFEPFTQLDSSNTREKGGTGLGLTVARSLARLLGGDLMIERADATGSTFLLHVPRTATAR